MFSRVLHLKWLSPVHATAWMHAEKFVNGNLKKQFRKIQVKNFPGNSLNRVMSAGLDSVLSQTEKS